MKSQQLRTFLPLRHIVAAIPLALTACTLEPTYQRPEQPVPNAWPTGPAYVQGTGAQTQTQAQAQTETPAASLGWEDFFTDPALRRLIELSLQNNRDLRMATLAIDQARAQYRIQRAAQFPAIDANAGMVASRVPGSLRAPGQPSVLHAYTAGVGFNAFELDVFGRVRSLKHEALEQYLAVQEVRRSAQISLVAEVASAYLTLQADRELLRISQDTLKIQQDAVQMVERSKKAGGMAQIDMHRAQTQLETARVGVEQYTRQVAQDENALAVLVGTQLPADLPPPQPFANTSFVAELPAGLPSALLEQRPDIMAAEHQLKAANANIGAARAAFFPSISLTAAIGVASTALSGLFSGGMAWAFAPSITMPIFNAGPTRPGSTRPRYRRTSTSPPTRRPFSRPSARSPTASPRAAPMTAKPRRRKRSRARSARRAGCRKCASAMASMTTSRSSTRSASSTRRSRR